MQQGPLTTAQQQQQQQQRNQDENQPKVTWIRKPTVDVRSLYDFGTVLGKGQFGTTRLVVEKKTKQQYACKSIPKWKMTTPEDVEDVKREVEIMFHLSGHPNVVTMRGHYEDKQYVHLVMEMCSGGELFDLIVQKGHYSEQDAANLIRTMIRVVAHCHHMGVIHRDLKPENFLLSDKSDDATLKAIDFGLSVFFHQNQQFHEIVGSAYYVAPEVLNGRYSKEADIWSCGVILYILLCGVPPFYGESDQQIFQAVRNAEVDFSTPPWPSISEPAKVC